MKRFCCTFLVLFASLLPFPLLAQSLEIHQIALDDADAGVIIVRNSDALYNIALYETLRGLLAGDGQWSSFNDDLSAHLDTVLKKENEAARTHLKISHEQFKTWIENELADETLTFESILTAFNNQFNNEYLQDDLVEMRIDVAEIARNLVLAHDATSVAPLTGTVKFAIGIDVGETQAQGQRVAQYLKKQGVEKLNYFIVSHNHKDHWGGFKELLAGGITIDTILFTQLNIGTTDFWTGGTSSISTDRNVSQYYTTFFLPALEHFNKNNKKPSDKFKEAYKALSNVQPVHDRNRSTTMDQLLKHLKHIGAFKVPKPGYKLNFNNTIDAKMICVTANSQVYGETKDVNASNCRACKGKSKRPNENDLSLSFFLEYGDFSYFTGGDLSGSDATEGTNSYTNIELPLMVALENSNLKFKGHACAFKVSHHGSQHSSSEVFLQDLHPIVGVIPNGYDNRFLNPRPEFYKRIFDLNIAEDTHIQEIFVMGAMEEGFTKVTKGRGSKPDVITYYHPFSQTIFQGDTMDLFNVDRNIEGHENFPWVINGGNTVIIPSDQIDEEHYSNFIVRVDGNFSSFTIDPKINNGRFFRDAEREERMREPVDAGVYDYQCTWHNND